MNFLELNAAVTDLRNVLRTFVGPNALAEINIRPPASSVGEASFLRLVAWCYVLNFEVGRIEIPYLLSLPNRATEDGANPNATRELVAALRTWCFHNLGFASTRDVALSQLVHRWFLQTCGEDPPGCDSKWKDCSETLCGDVTALVLRCRGAIDVSMATDDGGASVVSGLRRRIERAWPAYRFDEVIDDASRRLGIVINVKSFRESRIGSWRRFVESIPVGDDPTSHIVRLIEGELLDHAATVLPIDGDDVMRELGLDPGPDVAEALNWARRSFRDSPCGAMELLKRLREEREASSN